MQRAATSQTTGTGQQHAEARLREYDIAHGERARTAAARRRGRVLRRNLLHEWLPRLGDQALALLACLLLAPLLMLRALQGRISRGRWIEYTTITGRRGSPVRRYSFAGPGMGRGLAGLFNVLRGDLALIGATQQNLCELEPGLRSEVLMGRPGMISPADASRRVAIDHDGGKVALQRFLHRESMAGNAGTLARSLISRAAYGEQDFPAPAQLSFFGVRIQNVTMDAAVDWILQRSRTQEKTFVAFVNPHCLNIACTDEKYRSALESASCILPDGIGIRVGCRLKRQRLVGNVNGTDLFPRLCAQLARTGGSIFLLGAGEGVADQVAGNLQARFPGLQVAGTRNGFFSADEEPAVIDQINSSGASILLVAMGVPVQENWIARHRAALQTPVCMGVGGLFDFYSGRIPRAPMWLRELGLEWTWRLLQEPGRMWRRYLVGNPVFLARVWREARAERARDAVRFGRYSPVSQRLSAIRASIRRKSWLRNISFDYRLRRALDTLGASSLLLVLSPLLLLVAVAIRLESPGSVFFSQPRVGRHGRKFRFWKFRSMYQDAEKRLSQLSAQNEMAGGVLFKMREDPRVTRVGRIIRRFSIDELPQLWNVLRGDMSLVGPRPALPREVAQYAVEHRARLEATPGITCIWQVSGRSDIPFAQQMEMDREYINRSSLRTNLKLLLKTIPAVLSGRGAY